MEEETQVTLVTPAMKVIEDPESIGNPTKAANGDLPQVGKKEEEEANLDGEFIKVEKDSIDVKDSAHTAEGTYTEDGKPSVTERSISNSNRELNEAQEKVKELEIELERLAGESKNFEHENSKLKNEVLLTMGKLEESGKKYEELELSHKKVVEQVIEAEGRYTSELNTLREALQDQEKKNKELIDVKEAFDGLSIEFESSRKRMQELENDLQKCVDEARKFEELHKQSGSHAESETQKALEFERLLELAKVGAKEMENQMASLHEELKGLYEKIAENEKLEEALKSTTKELSAVQEELMLQKSQGLELEQRLSSREAVTNELTQELDQRRALESKVKEEISTLENLLAITKEDLHTKVSELEKIKLKLQEEVSARELVESGLKTQEKQVSIIKEDLAKVLKEKEAFEATVEDLNSNASRMKNLCSDLEEKLKLSDENFCKTDSLLSQALSNNAELEKRLKFLEELHNESEAKAATATQRNLELEDILRASSEEAEATKSQLREVETRCIAVEQKNVELEQQLNLLEQKGRDTERELKESSENLLELKTTLRQVEEEKRLLNVQMEEYQEKISHLESAVNKSETKNSELEEELRIAIGKCEEHENQATMHHQRSLELEDLFQTSHSKLDGAGKRVNELELLLEAEKYRIQELEEQIRILENKYGDSEANSRKYSDKITELASEVEAFQARTSDLEASLQRANEKEKELTEYLNAAANEKKNLEDASNCSSKKLFEAENLLEVLRNELTLAQVKLESMENDLKVATSRETEISEKLKSTEEQLEKQGQILNQTAARNSELESLHESLSRDSELKFQQAMEDFTNKDLEAKSLFEKVKVLEDQVKIYEEQVTETAERSSYLKEELDQSLAKLASLKNTNEEIGRQILEAEEKALQSSTENELLVETNIQLKSKIDELQNLLNSAVSDKEAAAQQLACHMITITELTDQHSRTSGLLSATEARINEAEKQLQDAIQRFGVRDADANDLNEKLNALEGQIKLYEKQAHEASALAESRKNELEEALLKVTHLESITEDLLTKASNLEKESDGMAETNLKLTEELTTNESKFSELQAKLTATMAEKDETVEQLHALKKVIEDLTEQISSEGQRFQSQISSLMEENSQLNETYLNAKNELQSLIVKLEEEVKAQQASANALESEIEKLKTEAAEKPMLHARLGELEQLLAKLEAQLEEEVGNVKAAAGREAGLCLKLQDHAKLAEDLKAQKASATVLESEIEKLRPEAAEKPVLHAHIGELEQQLAKLEAHLEEEVGKVKAASGREVELSLKLQDHAKLEEDLKAQKVSADALESEIEKLKAETAEKPVLHARLGELEQQLAKLDAQLEEEVRNVKAASGREAELSLKLQDHAKLEEDLKAQKAFADALESEIEKLRAEAAEKPSLHARIGELEQQLEKLETQMEEEVGKVKAASGREAELGLKLQDHGKLEEDLKAQKASADALESEIEKLKAEAAEKPVLYARLGELEQQLAKLEAQLEEEVGNVKAASGREAELALQLQDHALKVSDRDTLNEKVLELQRELQLAQKAIVEQREAFSQKEIEREEAQKHSLEELETKKKEVILLQAQGKELEQKLQLADVKVKSTEGNAVELKDGTDIKSRDIGLSFSAPAKRKSKKRSEAASAKTSTSLQTTPQSSEASHAVNFKFIIGVALMSIIIGVILGKRY